MEQYAKVLKRLEALELGSTSIGRGHIDGLILSNGTDADHDINIAAGEAKDSENTYLLQLSSVLTKRLDAAWAVGTDQGGLDTGAIAASKTYHVYLIRKDSDGTIDALFSLSVSAPTMPAGWSTWRRIGSVLTNSSANILGFAQYGDTFWYKTPTFDVNVTNQGTSRINYVLSVPLGVAVLAKMNLRLTNAAITTLYLCCPDLTDLPPIHDGSPLYTIICMSAESGYGYQLECQTNTSSQISARAKNENSGLRIAVLGWVDPRGKNA